MDVLEAIAKRCSVRFFKEEEIPSKTLEKIVWAATRAPCAGGIEKWFFIVVTDKSLTMKTWELLKKAHLKLFSEIRKTPLPPDKLEKLRRKLEAGMYKAPVYIYFYIDTALKMLKEEYNDLELVFDIQTIAAAVENMVLAAWSLGIGSCWLGVPLFMEEEFNRVVGIEKEKRRLMGILALGYPAQPVKPRPRKDLSENVKYLD